MNVYEGEWEKFLHQHNPHRNIAYGAIAIATDTTNLTFIGTYITDDKEKLGDVPHFETYIFRWVLIRIWHANGCWLTSILRAHAYVSMNYL